MKESSFYQAILAGGATQGEAHGALIEARRLLVRRGERQFGPISAADRALIDGITWLERLEDLVDLAIDSSAATRAEFWGLAGAGESA